MDKKHIILLIVIFVICILIVPLGINLLFKFYLGCSFFIAEWNAGDALSYYGTVLSFIGTSVLSILALYQNDLIKKESNERLRLIEMKEHESNMPKFSIITKGSIGKCSKMRISIKNISPNTVTNINFSDVKILSVDNKLVWENQLNITCHSICANNDFEFNLNNPQFQNDNDIIVIMMSCEDKYNEKHLYCIKGIIKNPSDFPHFKISEI